MTDQLRKEIREFVRERNWGQFHSPKNLAMGLSIEAAELMELFLWKSEEESRALSPDELRRLREELGDVLIFATNLADKFGIDPVSCAQDKLRLNREKYPPDLVRGSARKYDEYPSQPSESVAGDSGPAVNPPPS